MKALGKLGTDATLRVEVACFEMVRRAREKWSKASAEVRRLRAEYGTMHPADGFFAYQRALGIELEAHSEYRKAFQAFQRLVLYGSLPDESALPMVENKAATKGAGSE